MADKGAVVITGASTGIGEACALHLDKLGYRVFAGIRKAADGESLRRRASERLVPVRLDISDETEIAQAARNVIEALGGGGLAGLVNNAGIVVGGCWSSCRSMRSAASWRSTSSAKSPSPRPSSPACARRGAAL